MVKYFENLKTGKLYVSNPRGRWSAVFKMIRKDNKWFLGVAPQTLIYELGPLLVVDQPVEVHEEFVNIDMDHYHHSLGFHFVLFLGKDENFYTVANHPTLKNIFDEIE